MTKRPVSPPSAADQIIAERRRAALRAFMESRGLRAHPWAVQAGVASGTLYAFLKAETHSLTTPVLDKLAAVANVQISALLDEAEQEAAPGVIGFALRGASIIKLARPIKRPCPMPSDDLDAVWNVADVQSDVTPMLRTGALIYWRADTNPTPAAHIGRVCAITLDDGKMVVADLRKGFGKTWLLATIAGTIIDGASVESAFPIDWVRAA